jgi:MFS family permease
MEGVRYVWARPDLKAILLILLIMGSLGFNFMIFVAAMAVREFHADAQHYGMLSATMAIGTVAGALISASRSKPGFPALLISTSVFSIACLFASLAPTIWLFGAMLIVLGMATMTITTETNSIAQLSTAPHMRGRVMSLRLAVTLGGMPLGAPLMGWIANTYGPRWTLAVAAVSSVAAACIAAYAIMKKFERPESAIGGAREI